MARKRTKIITSSGASGTQPGGYAYTSGIATCSGAAGSATGNATITFTEASSTRAITILALAIVYSGAPNTTDLNLYDGTSTAGRLLYTRANSNTNFPPAFGAGGETPVMAAVVRPLAIDEEVNGTLQGDAVSGGAIVNSGSLYIDVVQSDPAATVTVKVFYQVLRKLSGTIHPAGADGSAVGNATLTMDTTVGSIMGLTLDYGAGVPPTTDLLIYDGTSTGGKLLFAAFVNNTDLLARNIGTQGYDENFNNAVASDAHTSLGLPYISGSLYIDVAQADDYTSNEQIDYVVFYN